MKIITLKIVAAVLGLSLVGCADLAQKFATSDGLIDFILAVSGDEQIDAYPAERISRGEGEIITAHARKDSRGAFVFGEVGKQYGAGWVTTAWSHVDVIVLDSKGRHLQSLATRFFPSTVPETLRGIKGRSSYLVRLRSVPPAGSTIIVAFHQVPMLQCGYSHDHQTDRSARYSQREAVNISRVCPTFIMDQERV